jgi:hypothetical protein
MHGYSVIAVLWLTSGIILPRPSSFATVRAAAAGATLRTDSTKYTVRFVSPMYHAVIGYVYTNGTDAPVSENYCRTPRPPLLEKSVKGHWVVAYDQIEFACQSVPPFRIAAGATYRGTLEVTVARPGKNFAPELRVAEIAGTYRLRWVLRSGNNPDDPRAHAVEAISAPFEVVER